MSLLLYKFSEEEFGQIMDLAGCNYSPEKIALQLGLDKVGFLEIYNNTESEVRQAFDAGKLKTQFNIMNKQKELAESGNITAAQIFLKESKEIEIVNIRNKCLFGDEY